MSATTTTHDFTMVSGDTARLDVSVTDDSGAPLNLTGATAEWVLADPYTTEVYVRKSSTTGGITWVDATVGDIRIDLAPVDTEPLAGEFTHELEVTDTAGNVSTVLVGTATIRTDYV